MAILQGTYTKLKTGAWGVRIADNQAVKAGALVEVTKRDGGKRFETVAWVLYQGAGVSLCTIKSKPSASSSSCAECGRAGASILCRDSSGISGKCCASCAALPAHERSFA